MVYRGRLREKRENLKVNRSVIKGPSSCELWDPTGWHGGYREYRARRRTNVRKAYGKTFRAGVACSKILEWRFIFLGRKNARNFLDKGVSSAYLLGTLGRRASAGEEAKDAEYDHDEEGSGHSQEADRGQRGV